MAKRVHGLGEQGVHQNVEILTACLLDHLFVTLTEKVLSFQTL